MALLHFTCTADPGWVTGMSYGIIAPLTHGVTSVVDEADSSGQRNVDAGRKGGRGRRYAGSCVLAR
jgi:hypothetical protein